MEPGVQLAGYAASEYILVIQPDEDVHEKVMLEKNNFAERYNAAASAFGKPNIVLLRFTQAQMAEERIIRQLRGIAGRCAPVKIELRDFGSEPTHSIFIKVASKVAVQHIVRQLRQVQRLMKYENTTPHFITEPRMMIARKLNAQQYEQAWKDYQQQSFSGRFMAGELVLLKRPAGLRSFQFVERFALMNKPVAAAQGALFF
ncbi:hypothetical protein SAMN05421788_101619 [Filimonas lacunae]|uniref:2'-5' RNA ligase superfamily protein n=1 Tax=Filimonas lacunae TaxID=477680 RepID=A0A173MNX4_9BACT|nr:2'-5' RNA ligase family protein [Filimonas lacunae]BAV09177.1 hypothetical protein FLA_5225 [Filimonas lacunae]SIS68461.1 hypothetical protein SAMN05421788_101619 [Filimonas lacunae]